MNLHQFQPEAQRRSRTWRGVPALLVRAMAVLALAGLTACGGDTTSDTDVASVTDTSTAPSQKGSGKKTPDPDAGRPQLRLDTSDEEETRLFNVWSACVHDHGVPNQEIVKDGKNVPDNSHRAYSAAAKACISKQPLDPPELDRAKNPHYMDDFRAEIACLHRAGVKVEPMADGEGYSWPSGEVNVPNLPELQKRCRIEAFSDKDE
ncbi:hypothetical protein AB0D14_31165 [Streptomyces sp. NPDC048484]|uniref:hypothetical protein n=1 Tax=Streptomyces sp. NPDC048484 TaxID=3155146 RepID=UPI00343B99CF